MSRNCCHLSRNDPGARSSPGKWACFFFTLITLLAVVIASRADSNAVDQLIRELGNDSFEAREAANQKLRKIGEPALALLRKAREDRDPEIRRRVLDLIRDIEHELYGEKAFFMGHKSEVIAVALAANGQLAASGSNDHTARIWDLKTGKELHLLEPQRGQIWAIAFTADSQQLVTGDNQGNLLVWEVNSGKLLHSLPKQNTAIRCLGLTPDGQWAVTGSYDHHVRKINLATGKVAHLFKGHSDSIMSLAVSPDGKRCLTGSGQGDRTVRLWDLETGNALSTLTGHNERIMGVAFAPDGKRAASVSWDCTARVWDVTAGKEVFRLEPHQAQLHGVSFTSNGLGLVLGAADGSVVLWDLEGKTVRQQFQGHTGKVSELRVHGDRLLLTGSGDRSVRLWHLPR